MVVLTAFFLRGTSKAMVRTPLLAIATDSPANWLKTDFIVLLCTRKAAD
jgi:hypothetical protein